MTREQVIERAMAHLGIERDKVRTTMLGGQWAVFKDGGWWVIQGEGDEQKQ